MLKQTIADCMEGINSEDITDFVVSSATTRRLLLTKEQTAIGMMDHRQLPATTTDAILTSYIVRTANPDLTYDTLTTQLTTAVDAGVFDTFLSTNAEQQGATELVGCQTSSVSTTYVDTSSGSSSKGLSAGVIAGIVIGVIVGVALIAAAVFCIFNKEQKIIPTSGGSGTAYRV